MHRGAWQTAVHRVAKSQTLLKQLSTQIFMQRNSGTLLLFIIIMLLFCCTMACMLLIPQPRIKPMQWKHKVLTTGLPENSQ